MTGLRLQLRAQPPGDCDAAALGAALRGLSIRDAGRLRLHSIGSTESLAVGDLFAVSHNGEERVVIDGDLRHLHRIGAHWNGGELVVEGCVGDGFASQMCGGDVLLRGHAGHGAAEQMTGGTLRISGDVGDHLATALPGRRRGMSGGRIVVTGDSGAFTAARMRRGTVVIHGSCGIALGADMVAGTIAVGATAGAHLAAGMRRGTIIVASPAKLSPLRFSAPCRVQLAISRLIATDLAGDAPDLAAALGGEVFRALGDLSAGGMGELWFCQH